jgi:hypothetical protein
VDVDSVGRVVVVVTMKREKGGVNKTRKKTPKIKKIEFLLFTGTLERVWTC